MKKQMQEAHKLARTELINNKTKSKDHYDKAISPLTISIGDRVLVQEKASKGKLSSKWLGPYSVIDVKSDSPNITILKKNRPVVLHRNLLRQFHERK